MIPLDEKGNAMIDEVVFVIDGAAERGGAVPADAFVGKLRTFMSLIYAFDRAFAHRAKRSIELEIVSLTRQSPAQVGMKVRCQVPGYPVEAAMDWTYDQLNKIQNGEPVDPSIPLTVIDNVIELATYRKVKMPPVSLIRTTYKNTKIEVDDKLARQALRLRTSVIIDEDKPWHSGISRGDIFGELRGVVDFEGEREFYIVPPSGPSKVLCVFPEGLRTEVQAQLWRPVRAAGFLHYDGQSPFPYLVEADTIGSVSEPVGHFSDLRGAFANIELHLPDVSLSL